MFDEVFINAICNVEGDLAINRSVDKIKYDTYNPFLKYYKLETILKVVEKYREKEIDSSYLCYWFNAYNWIINGGFDPKANKDNNEVLDVVLNELSCYLDSLSFFDKDEDDLDDYIEVFKFLDDIINYELKWIIFYTEIDDDFQKVLLVNESKQIVFEVEGEYFENGDETSRLVCLNDKEYRNKKKLLLALGYQEPACFKENEE